MKLIENFGFILTVENSKKLFKKQEKTKNNIPEDAPNRF